MNFRTEQTQKIKSSNLEDRKNGRRMLAKNQPVREQKLLTELKFRMLKKKSYTFQNNNDEKTAQSRTLNKT
jgi:hypothetical protein